MAYSIRYGVHCGEQQNRRSYFGLMTAVFLLTFLLGTHIFWPEGAQALRHLLLPVSDQTVNAFHTMVSEVSDGVYVPEAVAAFCREVIHSAQTP